jgi:hypothetical protein
MMYVSSSKIEYMILLFERACIGSQEFRNIVHPWPAAMRSMLRDVPPSPKIPSPASEHRGHCLHRDNGRLRWSLANKKIYIYHVLKKCTQQKWALK